MRRLLLVPVIAAGLLLAGCDPEGERCAAPLVAVDHGRMENYLAPVFHGKTMVMVPSVRWRSDWRCEEAGTR